LRSESPGQLPKFHVPVPFARESFARWTAGSSETPLSAIAKAAQRRQRRKTSWREEALHNGTAVHDEASGLRFGNGTAICNASSRHDVAAAAAAGCFGLLLRAAFLMIRPVHRAKDSRANGTGTWNFATGPGFRFATLNGKPPVLQVSPRPAIGSGAAGHASCAAIKGGGRRSTSMSAVKWLLMLVGAALFGSAGALVAYDIYLLGTTAAAFVAEQPRTNAAPT